MNRTSYLLGSLLVVSLSLGTSAQAQEPDSQGDPLAALRFFVGEWEGTISGPLGEGSGVRVYESILDDTYLTFRHSSVRVPQPESPLGDRHREVAIISYDTERNAVIYRQFVVEGFVLQYTCALQGGDALGMVCESESVENGAGMRARLTIQARDEFAFDETFDLAEPGQELERLFTNRWVRRPSIR